MNSLNYKRIQGNLNTKKFTPDLNILKIFFLFTNSKKNFIETTFFVHFDELFKIFRFILQKLIKNLKFLYGFLPFEEYFCSYLLYFPPKCVCFTIPLPLYWILNKQGQNIRRNTVRPKDKLVTCVKYWTKSRDILRYLQSA